MRRVKKEELPAEMLGLLQESVAGSDRAYLQMQRALPRYVDDAERDFGAEIYDRMARDPMVSAAVETLKLRTLEQGLRIVPADDSDESAAVARFCESSLEGLQVPFEETLHDLLDGLIYGHKLAEIVYEEGADGRIRLKSVKPKPRSNYSFVVDEFDNVTGVAALVPGVTNWVPNGVVSDAAKVLPLSKFLVLKFGGKNGDPRGASLLRPAYNPWWMKQQTWPQLMKFLAQFAGPSLIGYTPEDGPLVGANGQSPEQILYQALTRFQSGSVVVVRGGTKIDTVQSQGEGEAFLRAIDLYNREITHAILKQTRATMEAEHGSRADSQTGSELLDSLVHWVRGTVERAVFSQLIRPLVLMNFGEGTRVPRVTLKSVERPRFLDMAEAVARLSTSGFLDESQKSDLDEMLGLPRRKASKEGAKG